MYELCISKLKDDIPSENCNKVKTLKVLYTGPSGFDLTVTNKGGGSTYGTFSNIQNGDFIEITNNTGNYNGPDNNWEFHLDGNLHTTIHTSCSIPLLGMTFGDFYVLEYITPAGTVNTMIEESCCQATATINLSNLTVTASPDVEICTGESVTIFATAIGGTNPIVYSWDNGLGQGATKIVSPTSNTTYSVTATDSNNCTGTASSCLGVNIMQNAKQ